MEIKSDTSNLDEYDNKQGKLITNSQNAKNELNEIEKKNKEKNKKITKLWNKNFLLLWQGQLVSAIGDVFYEIALGFWVFNTTGSSALMGTLMATSLIPRILISPFAGVLVDRMDRKWIIVLMDFIRGLFVLLIAILAYKGMLEIWMVFGVAIILGTCASFFNPSVSSSIPDIIPKEKIVKGNSIFSMIYTGSGIIGNAGGGVIFAILGAPIMFLINGISYIFSAFTEMFIYIPKIPQEIEKKNFWQDMKEGFGYVKNTPGMKLIFINAAFLNFFFATGFVLMIPFFKSNPHLGEKAYGYTMAVMTGGMFTGFLFMSIVNISDNKRLLFFTISAIIFGLFSVLFPLMNSLYLILIIILVVGITNAFINNIINSILSVMVPQNKRGKIFSLIGTISMALSPLGMAFGGILGEIIPYRTVMIISFAFAFLGMLPIIISKSGRQFVSFKLDKHKG